LCADARVDIRGAIVLREHPLNASLVLVQSRGPSARRLSACGTADGRCIAKPIAGGIALSVSDAGVELALANGEIA